ncbi:hypothetical protein [Olsenella massiliensis]|uniref:hypothetical protein n=1 Tax=Olsenella massiliensis TaxID=1622075 RepID=UPI00071E367E|nr:hypothetical protein [Olsenella massiliensis]
MDDEALGLPRPKKCEGEQFTVLDYETEEYANARTLEEAIAIRSARAFLRDVAPDDFSDDLPGVKKNWNRGALGSWQRLKIGSDYNDQRTIRLD